jgi:hypothetical protein
MGFLLIEFVYRLSYYLYGSYPASSGTTALPDGGQVPIICRPVLPNL